MLLPTRSNFDDVQAELCAYQREDFPSAIHGLERVDKQWVAVSQVSNVCGAKKFKLLPQIVCGILAMPHSNATSEKTLSLVRKNGTDFRGNMSVKTLQALLIRKQQGGICHQQTLSKDLLN